MNAEKDRPGSNAGETAFKIEVEEPRPYEFEITLLTPLTKDAVKERARRNQVDTVGGVASLMAAPLLGLYKAHHGGSWPDIRKGAVVAGNRGRKLTGDRYVIPIENPDVRQFLEELHTQTGATRAQIVKVAMMGGLELTLARPDKGTTIH